MNHRIASNNKKNTGFTLIEVIVVVLILGLMASVAVLQVNLAYRSSAQKTAEKLSSYLDLVREQSMAMVSDSLILRLSHTDNAYDVMTIKRVRDSYGKVSENVLSEDTLCNASVTIFYEQGTGWTELVEGESIDFTFTKNSGAFSSSYTRLLFQASKSVELKLVKDTGRHYIVP